MSAVLLSDVSLRKRAETRRAMARRFAQIDAVLELVRVRVERASYLRERRENDGRKLVLLLLERRRELDRGLEELMRAPVDEWGWQLRDLEDARERLLDLLDQAVLEYVTNEKREAVEHAGAEQGRFALELTSVS